MLNISRVYCGRKGQGDHLRYEEGVHKRPVVVWNITRRCNLKCIHCYSDSENKEYPGEITTEEAKDVINDLADFKVPVLLFSGGEPLLRKDIFELAELASRKGIRVVLSTNGTLITEYIAKKIKEYGISYVGVSLDGIGETHDKLRGIKGAFENTSRGIRNLMNVGVRVGVRFTITKYNYRSIPEIFDFVEREGISRLCFYHLVYTGRGGIEQDIPTEKKRKIIDYILERTKTLHEKNIDTEVLTVDNHADGVYVYLKLKRENPSQAGEALKILRLNGGNSSGKGIASIDFYGNVHPDQFWFHYTLGNIRNRKFSEIWGDEHEPLLKALRHRKELIWGRCSRCNFFDICNGNFRVRAQMTYGDIWAPDPACYLADEEIGTEGMSIEVRKGA